ncbi:polysaccharide lyase 8 family protein [[Actinomadura] parvosata]|uniref:polysaccharide lyase 8 family protein n=1 Tax=[Actinomadura] parvosata TaxID=1955412 RepID=UPI00406C7C66
MSGGWTRRALLRAAGGAALGTGLAAGMLPGPAESVARPADLRARWRALLLGEGFDRGAEPYRSGLAELGRAASRHGESMRPRPGALWRGLPYAGPPATGIAQRHGLVSTAPAAIGIRHRELAYAGPAGIGITRQHDLVRAGAPADPGALSGNLHESFTRLRVMAEAYAQPGTGVTGDAALGRAVLAGLDHLLADVYRPGTTPYGNWWHWQIGGPQALLDTALLMSNQTSGGRAAACCAAVDAFVPGTAVGSYTGSSTGANRVDLCRVLALRGVLGGDGPRIQLARDALTPVFVPVTEGDGFYADGSFIQHRYVPYIGGYGTALFSGVAMLGALLRGTAWDLDGPELRAFLGTVDEAVAPFVYNGLLMDNVAGRGISRAGQSDHTRAQGMLASIALLAEVAGGERGERWRAMVKGWLERGRPVAANRSLGVARTARLLAVSGGKGRAAAEPVGHRLFPSMDRAVHRRPGWAASVSMASRRVAHYEYGNGENARGWHTGAGWLSWWGDGFGADQYADAFWATADPYRLPGITVSARRLADGEGGPWALPRPDATWVGGTTDGEFAAVGQDLRGLGGTLTARKAWFFLDDCVVCLGAGITCADGAPVETVVDNRNLGARGEAAVRVNGERWNTRGKAAGWAGAARERRAGVAWMHVPGHAGYVFPSPTDVHLLLEARTGSWRDVNAGGSPDPITRRYLTMWLDHGRDPVGAAYAYVLMPGATAQATHARAAARGRLRILANDRDAQAIRVPELGLTAANLWAPARVGPITASAPASVLIRERADGTAQLCVSDPPRGAAALALTWDRPVREVLSASPSVRAAGTGDSLRVTFADLRGTAGATQRITVSLA